MVPECCLVAPMMRGYSGWNSVGCPEWHRTGQGCMMWPPPPLTFCFSISSHHPTLPPVHHLCLPLWTHTLAHTLIALPQRLQFFFSSLWLLPYSMVRISLRRHFFYLLNQTIFSSDRPWDIPCFEMGSPVVERKEFRDGFQENYVHKARGSFFHILEQENQFNKYLLSTYIVQGRVCILKRKMARPWGVGKNKNMVQPICKLLSMGNKIGSIKCLVQSD